MVNVLCVGAGGFSAWYNPIWYSPDYMPTVPADLTKIREAFEKAVVRTHILPCSIASARSGGVHGWKAHHIIA